MKFEESFIAGLYEISLTSRRDPRGAFVKTFHRTTFADRGLDFRLAEQYYSTSRRGVLRGLHFQVPPHDHDKIVTCLSGEAHDVVLDLRVGSRTYGQHASFTLSAESPRSLYIPSGCAHGFLATVDDTLLVYNVTREYSPEHDTGVRWDSAGIQWPVADPLVSERDQSFPPLEEFQSPFA